MAAGSIPFCTSTKLPPGRTSSNDSNIINLPPPFQAMAATESPIRRSANFQPTIWDYDFLQSLRSDYVEEKYTTRSNELKEDVRMMLEKVMEPLDQLELIDILQRLGVSYHFKDEIKRILNSIINNNNTEKCNEENLYAVALEFRLLRQNGYNIPQEVFNSFKDESGNFKARLCEDIKGMICLYEASFLSMEGETILDDARNFAAKNLGKYIKENKDEQMNLGMQVSHALELPLHWTMPRLEARWFIDVYQKEENMNPILLEFAKLDFNILQAKHIDDLREVSRWSRNTGFAKKLSFTRDRTVENFFWVMGMVPELQFSYFRIMSTKIFVLITTIDDVYDVYGTLDELELFTDVVERWDINAIDQLPDYMKLCFLAFYNCTNEIAYDALKEQDCHILPHLKKVWIDLCKCYLVEARWYYSGYTPTLEEFIDNAWISVSVPVVLVFSYFLATNPIPKEALECLKGYPDIIRWLSLNSRFINDLGTSSDELKRGDIPKSIQCHMHDTGASEESAREKIRYLIGETWKKTNKDLVSNNSPLSQAFNEISLNLVRTAHCIYQYGDGFALPDKETKKNVLSLIIHPIPL